MKLSVIFADLFYLLYINVNLVYFQDHFYVVYV
jgi:hypothetical protein